MRLLPVSRPFIGTTLAFLAFQSPGATTTPEDRPIEVASSLEAIMPAALRSLLLEHPTVKFFVTIDETGALVDYLALEATHYDLLEPAERALAKVHFRPAVSRGKSVQASTNLILTFYEPSQRAALSGLLAAPLGGSSNDAVQRRIYENNKERFLYQRSDPRELDQPLAVTAARLVVLHDANGVAARGDCVVEFYVDRLGHARAPRVIQADNDTVALSAVMSVRETRYVPPTRHHAPTYVKVRQPIQYAPEPPVAEPQQR